MHPHFLRAMLIQLGSFVVLRKKLELKAPQEISEGSEKVKIDENLL